ncbi:MAG: sulfite exporter TauE/SafE family protein [Mobilitalea sp.]
MGQKIIKKTLKLKGLSCTACETRIENELIKMEGVQEAEVSYKSSTLKITYEEDKIKLEDIIQTIEKLDYGVKPDTDVKLDNDVKQNSAPVKTEVEKNPNGQLVIIGILLLGAYLIIKNTIGFNFIPKINPGMGYGILFVVGLLSSLHCVAMCGGINLSLCVSAQLKNTNPGKFSKLLPSLMYNAGRVVSYTIIGGIVGTLGSVFSISNTGSAFISILAGVFMVIMGLNMLNLFPFLRKLNPHMPKVFAGKIHLAKGNKGPFVVGMLNGLMPCGPLQAMQLYALGTGSFLAGALSMFMFSLGTVPLLFAFGALGSLLSSKFAKNMIKASAVLVMVLGFVMVSRGFAFTGITFRAAEDGINSSSTSTKNSTNTVNEDVQEITTTLESRSYPPLNVQAGIPVKWIINADAKNLNGCNGEIIIPEYNIKQKLVVGENIITFTPTEAGNYGYSCWMGMIRSSITVTAASNDTGDVSDTPASSETDTTGLPK